LLSGARGTAVAVEHASAAGVVAFSTERQARREPGLAGRVATLRGGGSLLVI